MKIVMGKLGTDCKVYNGKGEDITGDLRIQKIKAEVSVGNETRVEIYCHAEVDIEGFDDILLHINPCEDVMPDSNPISDAVRDFKASGESLSQPYTAWRGSKDRPFGYLFFILRLTICTILVSALFGVEAGAVAGMSLTALELLWVTRHDSEFA